jgi:hypothetical protein
VSFIELSLPLEHDPEKWKPVFRSDHAQSKSKARLHLIAPGTQAQEPRNDANISTRPALSWPRQSL